MIVVKNREMLIPNAEYNIGTNIDSYSENRIFQIERVSSSGVDLANLTYRIDLQYSADRPIAGSNKDTVVPSVEITDDYILLTWTVTQSQLEVPGSVLAQISAFDESNKVRWSSFIGAFFVEDAINTPGTYTGDLSAVNQFIAEIETVKTISADEATRKANETIRVSNEKVRNIAENLRETHETTREEWFGQAKSTYDDAIAAKNDAIAAKNDAIAAKNQLEEAITQNPGSTVVDPTFSIAGAAAEAKAVGNLKSDLTDLKPTKLFIDRNDFIGNPLLLENVLQVPYELNDFVIKSVILSSGNIGTGDMEFYKGFMVSPLIPIVGGKTYAIKTTDGIGEETTGQLAPVNNGYGLFGEDGTSVISKTSFTDLGNNIVLIKTTVGASYIRFTLHNSVGTNDEEDNNYRLECVNKFNKWFMVADADENITADDFIEHPVENSTISKIKRADGSKLEIADDYSRQKIYSMGDVSKIKIRRTGVVGTPNFLSGKYTSAEFTENAIILSSGNIGIDTSTYRHFMVSPLIPIVGGKTYAIKTTDGIGEETTGQLAPANNGYGLFGEDGTSVISKTSFTDLGNNIVLIKTTVGASYIRFTIVAPTGDFLTSIDKFNKWFMIETDKDNVTEDDFIVDTTQYHLGGIVMDTDTVPMDSLQESNVILPLYGKTIVNFGDSIFGNIRPPYDLSTLIAKYTIANVINCAFGGCRMSSNTGHWDAFSMYRLADSVASNDWSVQDDAIQYDDRTSYAEEPLANLKTIDWNNVDIITIGYCTNDYRGNKPLDNSDNIYDTTTLGGAFRYSLERILTAYPHIRIVTLGAIYRTKLDSSNEFVEDSDTWLNDIGLLLSQYNDKLKEICEQYHIEYLENMNIGFNKFTRLEFYPLSDGTHPNVKGLDVYAKHIARHL